MRARTLAGLPGPVRLVLLDGWKDLCLPVLRLLEPALTPGALVAADDNTLASMSTYLAYVRNPAKGVHHRIFPGRGRHGVSSWTGRPDR